MKRADGGFRPAYNCQVATVAQGQIVVDITALACGPDRGLMRPMLERLEQRHGCRPRRHLVDGGFHKNDDTEWAAETGIRSEERRVGNACVSSCRSGGSQYNEQIIQKRISKK